MPFFLRLNISLFCHSCWNFSGLRLCGSVQVTTAAVRSWDQWPCHVQRWHCPPPSALTFHDVLALGGSGFDKMSHLRLTAQSHFSALWPVRVCTAPHRPKKPLWLRLEWLPHFSLQSVRAFFSVLCLRGQRTSGQLMPTHAPPTSKQVCWHPLFCFRFPIVIEMHYYNI